MHGGRGAGGGRRPSTTLYYKACTKYVPGVLLCTTKACAKLLPSTTLYYKACQHKASFYTVATLHLDPLEAFTQHVRQGLLCTTSLHKELPSFYTQQALSQRSFYTQSSFLLHSLQAFTHSTKLLHTTSFYTEKLLHTASFHTQQAFTHRTLTHSAFTHGKRLHTQQAFTHRSFYTQQAFTQRSFYTQQAFTHSKRLHTEHLHTVLLHMASVYTKQAS